MDLSLFMLSKGEKHVEAKNRWYEIQNETKGCTNLGGEIYEIKIPTLGTKDKFFYHKKGGVCEGKVPSIRVSMMSKLSTIFWKCG